MMMTVSGLEAMIYNDFSAVPDIIVCLGGELAGKQNGGLARGL